MVSINRTTPEPADRGEPLTAERKRELIAMLDAVLDHPEGEIAAAIIELFYQRWVETN